MIGRPLRIDWRENDTPEVKAQRGIFKRPGEIHTISLGGL